jgi:hypothetical protein
MKPISLTAFGMLLVALMMSSGHAQTLTTNAPTVKRRQLSENEIKARVAAQQMQQAVLVQQDLKEIQRILKAGFNINDPIGCGTFNSVDGAVALGNVKMLKFFLANGAQPKSSALLQAVWCKQPKVSLEMVETLLQAGADAGYKEYYRGDWVTGDTHLADTNRFNSPLHVAAYQGYAEVVELLLSHKGVELNALDINGYTPLMRAVEKRNEKIVKLLLAKGADVNKVNGRDQTALNIGHNVTASESKISEMIIKAAKVTQSSKASQASLQP